MAPPPRETSLELGVTSALRAVIVVGLLMTLGTVSWLGVKFAGGVALGALLGALNLWVLAHAVRRIFGAGASSARWSLIAAVKFLALLLCAYWFMRAGVAVLAMMVGFGALPLGIVISQLRSAQPSRL